MTPWRPKAAAEPVVKVLRTSIGVLLLVGVGAGALDAQLLRIGGHEEAYLRLLQVAGAAEGPSFTVRPLPVAAARAADSLDGHPWAGRLRLAPTGSSGQTEWTLADTRLRGQFNTNYARGGNDGAAWQGKGGNLALETEASLVWRGLTVSLNPLLLYSQNQRFQLAAPTWSAPNEYAYAFRRIDWPQRFGPDPVSTFDPGQSHVALEWRAARVSFGTENLSWGPAIDNPIILSANAPGFVHASLGTSGPVDIGIGTIEGQWIWGGLEQSDWFDPALADTARFMTGIVVTYGPSFLDGLSVGATRVFQEFVPPGGLSFSEYFLVFQGLTKDSQRNDNQPSGTDARDQLLSIFARWVFPESGLELYMEYARTDHARDLFDLFQEPEHSRGYTLGAQKILSFSAERALMLRGEMTQLESSPTFQLRPRPTYYEHSVVTQGYTHKGQILGAAVGPGGNAQKVAFDWYAPWGRATAHVRRQVHDNDAFWEWAEANDGNFSQHHVSFDFGADALYFLGDLELGAGVVFTREWNRYFYGPKTINWNLATSVRWRPTFD